jgi:MFS family permease
MTPAPRPAPEPFVTREYVVLTIANVLFVNNFYALLTVTPTYAMKTLGLDEADAGLATGVFVVGMLVSRFLAGRLVEKIGCRPLLLSSIGSLVVFTLLYFVAYTLPSLCAVRLLSGFAYGMASNTFITRISMIVPKSRSGAGVGYYTMFQMICWATGPYIATTLAKKNMFDALFLFATILPAISFALIVFLRVRVEPEEKKAVANAPPRLADKIGER